MKTAIYLDSSQVPPQLRGTYRGGKFQLQVATEVYVTEAGWHDGTKETFRVVFFETGEAVPLKDVSYWRPGTVEQNVIVEPGIAVIRHAWFRGVDMGLTLYVHPWALKQIVSHQSRIDLTEPEKKMLRISYTYAPKARQARYSGAGLSIRQIEVATQGLKQKGMFNKAGALTTIGKNRARLLGHWSDAKDEKETS